MTCIVGCIEPETGNIYMGGDSATSNSEWISAQADSKVVKKRDILIGCAGDPLVGDILRQVFVPPIYHAEKKNLLTFLLTDFTRAIMNAFKEAGKESEQLEGSEILIGLHGRLFQIEEKFHIMEAHCRYDAIGSGAFFALGAMHVTPELSASERISRALAAAEAHCPSVRGPFSLEQLEPCYQAPKRNGWAYGFW